MHEHSYQGLSPEGFHHLTYLEWGEGEVPVICVHGLTRNAWDFTWLAEALQGTRRVIAPNIVGRGSSAHFHNPAFYTYPQYLADLNTLLAHLGVSKVDWVGTSMGGLLGMMLASFPHSPIRRLVLNDIGPFVPKEGLQRLSSYAPHAQAFSSLQGAIVFLQTVLKGYEDVTEEQWQYIARHSFTWNAAEGLWKSRYDAGIAGSLKDIKRIPDINLWNFWETVSCPVLLLHGEESDILTHETTARMCQKPHVTYKKFPGKGHALSLATKGEIELVRGWLEAPL
jgi:pimeloyl-ACP methyl ester carboxylesterase